MRLIDADELMSKIWRYGGGGRWSEEELDFTIKDMPTVEPNRAILDDLATFVLDEIWDEDLWELNWRAFPEIICRKMVRLGYVNQTEEGYERTD